MSSISPWWQSNFWSGLVGALVGGLIALLAQLLAAWLQRRQQVEQARDQVIAAIAREGIAIQHLEELIEENPIAPELLFAPIERSLRALDQVHGFIAIAVAPPLSFELAAWGTGVAITVEGVGAVMRRRAAERAAHASITATLAEDLDEILVSLKELQTRGYRLGWRVWAGGRRRAPRWLIRSPLRRWIRVHVWPPELG